MKNSLKLLLATLALLFTVGTAQAWNCPTGQIRQQAPAGTPTTAPNYDVVEGIAFICVPTNPPSPTPSSSTQNQSQTQSQSQNTSASAASNSKSSSASSAQGGSAQATGGSATGGSSVLKNSGNSNLSNVGNASLTNSGNSTSSSTSQGGSVKNSGNSSNSNKTSSSLTNSGNSTNSLSAKGGNQSQSSTSSASNNGNGANNSNYQSNTKVEAAASTAFASALPTAPCVIGFGAGGQSLLGGLSFSGGKVDKNCAILETARSLANFGSDISYCRVMLTNKYVKAAGVTLDECLATRKQVVPVSAPIEPSAPIIVNVPPQPQAEIIPPVRVEAPVVENTAELRELGSCNIFNGISNVCKRYADDAIVALNANPDTQLVLMGPHQGAGILTYLHSRGISSSRVRMSFADEQNWVLSFELYTVTQ